MEGCFIAKDEDERKVISFDEIQESNKIWKMLVPLIKVRSTDIPNKA